MDKLTFDQDFEDKYYSGKKKNSSKSLVVAVVILILIGLGICYVLLRQYLNPKQVKVTSSVVSEAAVSVEPTTSSPINSGLSDISIPDVLTLPELEQEEEITPEPEPIVVSQEPISEVLVQFLNIPAAELVVNPVETVEPIETIEVVEKVEKEIEPEIVVPTVVPEITLPPIDEIIIEETVEKLTQPEVKKVETLYKKGIITDINLVKDFKKANKK